jgi:hypothetical protein
MSKLFIAQTLFLAGSVNPSLSSFTRWWHSARRETWSASLTWAKRRMLFPVAQ